MWPRKWQRSKDEDTHTTFMSVAEVILPLLSPRELASVSSTCKTLARMSQSITLRRSSDASRSLEKVPVPFVNASSHIPYAFFVYAPSQVLSFPDDPPRQSWGGGNAALPPAEPVLAVLEGSGCGCGDECELLCPCVAGECGVACGCGLDCPNRVRQRGLSLRLKIVRDDRKGWCLFSDQFIRRGQFVCEYAGELLVTREARRRQQLYDELASGGRFSSALLVMREHLPSGKACLRINIDATKIGNVARFINHSCDGGNLSTSLVRSSGALLPHLCFFASKDIKANEELTFSYGEIRIKSNGLKCFCGSSCCFGMLPSEHT